ncbi:MAG TPA: hypothetical protein VMI75_16090, partial [Polyangiaceae bacterium]|nr:hypothetical protein [Polyangiaceae bacterium]
DWSVLAEWFDDEPLARLRIEFASHFADLLPSETVEALTREGLADASPALRYHALTLVSHLNERRQRAVLAAAVADEPDTELRAEMKRALKHLGRG